MVRALGLLYVQAVPCEIDQHFSDISDNLPKKRFRQKSVRYYIWISKISKKSLLQWKIKIILTFLSGSIYFWLRRVVADVATRRDEFYDPLCYDLEMTSSFMILRYSISCKTVLLSSLDLFNKLITFTVLLLALYWICNFIEIK